MRNLLADLFTSLEAKAVTPAEAAALKEAYIRHYSMQVPLSVLRSRAALEELVAERVERAAIEQLIVDGDPTAPKPRLGVINAT